MKAAEVPEEDDLSMFSSIELTYSPFLLRLSVDVNTREAEHYFAEHNPAIQDYIRNRNPLLQPPPGLVKLRADMKTIRTRIAKMADDAWRIVAAKSHPRTIDGSASLCNPDSNEMMGSIGFHLIYGRLTCPSCNASVAFSSSTRDEHGWTRCNECDAYLIEPATQDIGLSDGVHRVTPGVISANAAHQLFLHGHTDESSFLKWGPVSEWFKGRIRLYVYALDSRLVGYSYWNNLDDDTPVLRQVWVHYDYRRRGIGQQLLHVEAKGADGFGVESPNKHGQALIRAAGYDGVAFHVTGM